MRETSRGVDKKLHDNNNSDSSIYEAMVNLAQDFSTRYPLIDMHGNVGSLDGDPAAAMRYCVVGDTLVNTDSGLVKIKNIASIDKNSECEIDINVQSIDKINKASKFFSCGEHPTKKITLKNGLFIEGSYNHPILVLKDNLKTEWVTLDKIKTEDIVLVPKNENILQSSEDKITVLDAQYLGLMINEGYISSDKQKYNRVGFSNKDAELLDKVREYYSFNDIKFSEDKKECTEIYVHGEFFWNKMQKDFNFDFGSKSKVVPSVVLQSSLNIQKEFLSYLFDGDGGVCKSLNDNKGSVFFSSSSESLINQIQIILLQFGISSKKYPDRSNYRIIIKGKSIKKFYENIGFASSRKQAELEKVVSDLNFNNSNYNKFPLRITSCVRKSAIKNKEWIKKNFLLKDVDKTRESLSEDDFNAVINLTDNFFFEDIKSIEDTGMKNVYSVRVDSDCHSFVANGFVNHNTESRLTAIADEAMKDIEKNTVDMTDNFDGTVLEPTALPSLIPLTLANGSEGIAVGMATKMPPHNLTEILDAADYIIAELLEGREADPEEIFKIIKGPDFPLGAVIVGKSGIRDAFFTGRGQISVKSEYEIEELGNSSSRIAISSIPYQVNKSNLVDKIESLRKTTIPEIKEVRDESDKDGIRICIDLKKDTNAQLIVNKLMKHTQLQANFNVNNTVIINKKPESVGTVEMLQHYIAHCISVITRRSVFDYEKASARFNIVSGILWAINPEILDDVIHAIRTSRGTEEAIAAIMSLSDEINEEQAKAIAEMKLRQLTTDNEDRYISERDLLSENIKRLTEIIEDSSVMLTTLRSELSVLKDKFGDARRTKIVAEEGNDDELDCIEDETLVVTFSTSGIVKSVEEKEYRSTNRGAKGVKTAEIKDNDAIKAMMTVGSKEDILFFTNLGRCHVLKAYKIQKTSRTARGKSINNYLNLEANETIVSLMTADLSDKQNSFALVTKNGIIKRLSFENLSTRRTVTKVMNFKDNDMLIAVQTLTDEEEILLTSACGMSIRFKGSDVRMSGRTAEGVKAINLRKHDYVVDAVKVIDGQMLLTITQFGMGKKTKVKDYTLQSRAGKGIITHKLNENTGELVCANIVDEDDEIFIATAKGQIVRVDANNISTYGRSTIGVKVVSLAEDDYIIAVSEAKKETEEAEEGN